MSDERKGSEIPESKKRVADLSQIVTSKLIFRNSKLHNEKMKINKPS